MAGSKDVIRNLNNYCDRLMAAVEALGKNYTARMESDAKQNAPWTDRTGNARQGLFGYTRNERQKLTFRIAHSVRYGVYLELAHQGRFRILRPTAKKFAPRYFQDVKRLVRQ